jgi:hypothetical protein
LPVLYLRGISTGDFQEALAAPAWIDRGAVVVQVAAAQWAREDSNRKPDDYEGCSLACCDDWPIHPCDAHPATIGNS